MLSELGFPVGLQVLLVGLDSLISTFDPLTIPLKLWECLSGILTVKSSS